MFTIKCKRKNVFCSSAARIQGTAFYQWTSSLKLEYLKANEYILFSYPRLFLLFNLAFARFVFCSSQVSRRHTTHTKRSKIFFFIFPKKKRKKFQFSVWLKNLQWRYSINYYSMNIWSETPSLPSNAKTGKIIREDFYSSPRQINE